MAPMQESPLSNNGNTRQPSKGQKWNFIFVDPTFGGECPHVPYMKKRSSVVCSASPVFAEMPSEVQEMLLGNPPAGQGSDPVAGSGKKAVDYLRRLSQDSGSGLSGSGLSDGSDDGDKKSDSGSGFSDMSAADQTERQASKNASAKLSSGGAGSDRSSSKDRCLKNDAVDPTGAPLRNNRRADTVVEKPEKSQNSSMSSDEDLLSNPFASDSDEDKASGMESEKEACV